MARAKAIEKTREEIELRPDGWERFRLAVSIAAKSSPKHRSSKIRKSKSPKSRKR